MRHQIKSHQIVSIRWDVYTQRRWVSDSYDSFKRWKQLIRVHLKQPFSCHPLLYSEVNFPFQAQISFKASTYGESIRSGHWLQFCNTHASSLSWLQLRSILSRTVLRVLVYWTQWPLAIELAGEDEDWWRIARHFSYIRHRPIRRCNFPNIRHRT